MPDTSLIELNSVSDLQSISAKYASNCTWRHGHLHRAAHALHRDGGKKVGVRLPRVLVKTTHDLLIEICCSAHKASIDFPISHASIVHIMAKGRQCNPLETRMKSRNHPVLVVRELNVNFPSHTSSISNNGLTAISAMAFFESQSRT